MIVVISPTPTLFKIKEYFNNLFSLCEEHLI